MINYENYSDESLSHLLKSGDHHAFTEIYRRYTGILQQHAYSKLLDREEAMDVVQELFTWLWLKRDSIQFNSNLSGYLYTAIRNRIINIFAHKKISTDYISSLQNFIDQGQAVTDYQVREKDLKRQIESEVAQLPEKMRQIFEMSRKAGLPHKEIALKLNLSEKTVKNQINNSLKILRGKLGPLFFIFLTLYK